METFRTSIDHDIWLEKILERDVFKVKLIEDRDGTLNASLGPKDSLESLLAKKSVFLYSKISSDQVSRIRYLEKLGFNLADTTITFEKKRSKRSMHSEGLNVRMSALKDKERVMEIAASSFKYSRFHMDNKIPTIKADRIKAEWAGNFFTGQRGDEMVVAVVNGKVAGFLLLLCSGETIAIDLVAVEKKYLRKGLAMRMICFAETALEGFRTIRVGTQAVNIPSMRFYESLGFCVIETGYVFHYHNL